MIRWVQSIIFVSAATPIYFVWCKSTTFVRPSLIDRNPFVVSLGAFSAQSLDDYQSSEPLIGRVHHINSS